MTYILVRERDGLTKVSNEIKWLEFNDKGLFKDSFKEIGIGRSLIMSPFNRSFTWQTTLVKSFEIIDDRIEFTTENSNYTLTKGWNDDKYR